VGFSYTRVTPGTHHQPQRDVQEQGASLQQEQICICEDLWTGVACDPGMGQSELGPGESFVGMKLSRSCLSRVPHTGVTVGKAQGKRRSCCDPVQAQNGPEPSPGKLSLTSWDRACLARSSRLREGTQDFYLGNHGTASLGHSVTPFHLTVLSVLTSKGCVCVCMCVCMVLGVEFRVCAC
jgi:hypothetical protein